MHHKVPPCLYVCLNEQLQHRQQSSYTTNNNFYYIPIYMVASLLRFTSQMENLPTFGAWQVLMLDPLIGAGQIKLCSYTAVSEADKAHQVDSFTAPGLLHS